MTLKMRILIPAVAVFALAACAEEEPEVEPVVPAETAPVVVPPAGTAVPADTGVVAPTTPPATTP